ncbi:hypothetical protein HWV62_1035 [Athelia sp. TMB]|nr:hypothetical protein HWV62_1035 [Athelia sp. TMB]
MKIWRAVRFEDYDLLPSDRSNLGSLRQDKPTRRRFLLLLSLVLFVQKTCSLRRIILGIASLPMVLVFLTLWSGVPPDYRDIREYERALPQHNLSLPYPAGQDGLYLRFPDHLWGHGLNNILQEVILMAHLAHAANRSFVFEDYEWSRTPFPWTIYNFRLRPKRIPLNAFIAGPLAGGAYLASDIAADAPPRAISAEWWETVCPPDLRYTISSELAPHGPEVEGADIMQWWVDELAQYTQHSLFGTTRMLSLWPQLSVSPILASFAWSPLVQSAVARNFVYGLAEPSPLTGLVAIHLRRGDYGRHCPRLVGWGSTYMGLNQFPALPDKFAPPAPQDEPETFPEALGEYYLSHCYPSVSQIVARLHQLRIEHPSLSRVYVLSNGRPSFLRGLRAALLADSWADAITSASVAANLDTEQEYVGVAVDMAIAEKAEVFVGNGFSSLSANVVMLRMAKGVDPRTNRFL